MDATSPGTVGTADDDKVTITSASVDALILQAKQNYPAEPKRSFELAQTAYRDAIAINYLNGKAEAALQIGICHSAKREYPDALLHYNEALSIYEDKNDDKGISAALSKIGNVHLYEGKYNEALECYDRAVNIKIHLNDVSATADIRTNTAIIYGLLGHHVLALQLHLEALKTYEASNEYARIASSCSNIGLIYWEQKNFDEALKMFNRALEIRQENGDLQGVGDLLNNIGHIYQEQNNHERALKNYKSALALREPTGDKLKIAYSYINLGNCYKNLLQAETALDYYKKALDLCEQTKDKRGILQTLISLGIQYFDLSQFEEADYFLHKAQRLADELGLKSQHSNAMNYITLLYEQKKQFEKAFYSYRQYVELQKELLNVETSRQISQLTARSEIEQRAKLAEAERLKSETERIKNQELQRAYKALDSEKKRSEELLLNILPVEISDELKRSGRTKARFYEMATVMFADVVGFTYMSEQMGPEELVSTVGEYFEIFDRVIGEHGIEKIKTIGDAYLCVGGIPVPSEDHALKVVSAAMDVLKELRFFNKLRESQGKPIFSFRFGIHSGPLVAGVVGTRKFAYDVWGDTVNTAARMEQHGIKDRIQLSAATYRLVMGRIPCELRGEIEAKHKGKLEMYLVA